jgi:beta-alanine--pyruvate transaminase
MCRAAGLSNCWHDAMHSLRDVEHVIDVRTIGPMPGIELAPRADAPGSLAYDVFADCFERGLLIRFTGDIIAFSPPLIANDSHVDAIVSILSDALKRAA